MTQEVNSQDTGINVDNLDEGNDIDNVEKEDVETKSIDEKPKTKKSNVAKILAEKNSLKKQLEEANKKLEGAEFDEEKVNNLIQKAILETKSKELEKSSKDEFINIYGEEQLEKVEAIRLEHPSLDYMQASKIADLDTITPSDPNRLSFGGNTPLSLKQKKTIQDLSDDELKQKAAEEIKNMLGLY